MKALRIFVIDDEEILRVSLTDDLKDAGYFVYDFPDAISALADINKVDVNVVITDIKMPDMDGIELLKKIKQTNSDIIVIVMTAYGSISSAVDAVKLGAYDYLTKPFQKEEILLKLARIEEIKTVKENYQEITSQLQSKFDFSSAIGNSAGLRDVFEQVKTVAPTSTTVLVTGETGTGKELLTNIIHYNSQRKDKPIIKVSCAILSREIFESELFGHEKGAFTGADKLKKGRFELSDNATIYLDDIDDIPFELQVKLLRVLEEHEFERVGSVETIKIDCRVIASTKKDLRKLVSEGKFREDLFYRLNVFPIHIKPLRERKEDIPLLAKYFMEEFSPNKKIEIKKDALDLLVNYTWPGNVRELKNLMERLSLLTNDGLIDTSKIPFEFCIPVDSIPEFAIGRKTLDKFLEDIEIKTIRSTVQKANGNKAKAAELLGLPVSTLRSKIEKYKIE
jgi:DNA-binding NtrC family response regulator